MDKTKSVTVDVYTKAVSGYIRHGDQDGYSTIVTTTVEEDAIRQEYLQALQPLETVRREISYSYGDNVDDLEPEEMDRLYDAFMVTRGKFMQMIEEIKQSLEEQASESNDVDSNDDDICEVVIMTSDGKVHQFPAEQGLIMVGVIPFNDIVPPGRFGVDGVSRLHVVIAQIRGKLVVMDLGSQLGVETHSRSKHTRERKNSKPGARCPLLFDLDETVVLRLGREKITIAPKNCTVCESQPRQAMFEPCNHFVMCHNCAQEWLTRSNRCPICRSRVRVRMDNGQREFYQCAETLAYRRPQANDTS